MGESVMFAKRSRVLLSGVWLSPEFELSDNLWLVRRATLVRANGTPQSRYNPIVETFPLVGAQFHQLPMQGGIDSQEKSSRIRFSGHLSTTLAELKIVINRLLERSLQLSHGTALKCHDIPDAGNVPMEDLRLVIKAHGAPISFVCDHGCIPASVRKRRIDFTAPLSVAG